MVGRAVHSSTFPLNVSTFCRLHSSTFQLNLMTVMASLKLLTLSSKVDDCKPFLVGLNRRFNLQQEDIRKIEGGPVTGGGPVPLPHYGKPHYSDNAGAGEGGQPRPRPRPLTVTGLAPLAAARNSSSSGSGSEGGSDRGLASPASSQGTIRSMSSAMSSGTIGTIASLASFRSIGRGACPRSLNWFAHHSTTFERYFD